MSTIRSLLEKHAQLPEKEKAKGREVSFYYLAQDIAENQGGMEIIFDARYWKKKPPGKRKFNGTRHVAVQKLLEQRK
jgi:hypothetical protein